MTDYDPKQIIDFLQDERNSMVLYQTAAETETNPYLAEFYRKLAQTEKAHAERWAKKLEELGVPVPKPALTWRTKTLVWLGKRFGANMITPVLGKMEQSGAAGYSSASGTGDLALVEQSHARLLKELTLGKAGGIEGGVLAQIEGRHRSAGGNALRAAVLGANDGLVSNFSLVMGVAGAELAGSSILLTGMAGLLAGAISMALGEWISVQSSRELYQKQIHTEEQELAQFPEEEMEELALIYQARGISRETANSLAKKVLENKKDALEILVREELSIDPKDLGGSAWEAALTSFFLFAVGAILPVIPYLFTDGMPAVILSAVLSAAGLFGIGASITLFTGRPVLYSGIRQMLFGLAAAAVTFGIGRLLGVNLAG